MLCGFRLLGGLVFAGCAAAPPCLVAVEGLGPTFCMQFPFDDFYQTENPCSTSDILLGSADSWSPIHMDLPLHTWWGGEGGGAGAGGGGGMQQPGRARLARDGMTA